MESVRGLISNFLNRLTIKSKLIYAFALLVILIVGALAVALAFIVENAFTPPIWVHLIYQIPFVLGASILLLRPLKATLIALQYRHHVAGFNDRPSE